MNTPRGSVDAILMAAGFSRRFGAGNKLLAPFCGVPLALHTLRLACAMPEFSAVYFIYADNAVSDLANGLPAMTIHNPNPALGQRESVRLGVSASRADYLAFFPCDMPLLTAEAVRAVLAQRAPGKIAFPTAAGKPGNPAVFSSAFREELLALKDGEGARAVKARHPEALVPVPLPSPAALHDIDTLQDLNQL